MTLNQLKTRAKALDLMIRKDGKGGYLLVDPPQHQRPCRSRPHDH